MGGVATYRAKSKLIWKHLLCPKSLVRKRVLLVGSAVRSRLLHGTKYRKIARSASLWWWHTESSFGKDKLHHILPNPLQFAVASLPHRLWLGICEWEVPTSLPATLSHHCLISLHHRTAWTTAAKRAVAMMTVPYLTKWIQMSSHLLGTVITIGLDPVIQLQEQQPVSCYWPR